MRSSLLPWLARESWGNGWQAGTSPCSPCELCCDWCGAGCSHSDVWADLWRALESSGYARRCDRGRYFLAGRSGLHACAVRGSSRRSDCRAFDVWAALVFSLLTFTARVDTGSERVRCNVRIAIGDLGIFAKSLRNCAVCRRKLYHCCILVYCINFLCKSGSNSCSQLVRYIYRHQTGRCAVVYRSTNRRILSRDGHVSLARSELANECRPSSRSSFRRLAST